MLPRNAGLQRLRDRVLLPFLYRTPTILRNYSTDQYQPFFDSPRQEKTRSAPVEPPTHHRPRRRDDARNEGRRPPNSDSSEQSHIPFENAPTSFAEADETFKDSTITPGERKVFETLFRLSGGSREQEPAQMLSPKQRSSDPLDSILDNVVAQERMSARASERRARRRGQITSMRHLPAPKLPDALRPMAEAAREERRLARAQSASKVLHGMPDPAREAVFSAAKREVVEIRPLMQNAQTDVQVWTLLREKVFDRIAALQLDDWSSGSTRRSRKLPKSKTGLEEGKEGDEQQLGKEESFGSESEDIHVDELELLSAATPTILLEAFKILAEEFPGSPLPLCILPTLKQLGPSAFAVAADTALYNRHMRLLYTRYTDVGGVLDTLAEMDKSVYEFSSGTLKVLWEIQTDEFRAKRGDLGPAVRVIWTTDRMKGWMERLKTWRETVMQRRMDVALRDSRNNSSSLLDRPGLNGARRKERRRKRGSVPRRRNGAETTSE